MILETSYLVDLFDGRQNAFERGLDLVETGAVQRVPSPVIVELSDGVAFGGEEERRNVQNALRMYPIAHQDERLAQRAGELLARADVASGGESGIDEVDPVVAAVAERYDEPVLTANVADFDALGVTVETY